MNKEDSPFNREEKVKLLLVEYDAIERMHSHYDVLNMSMTAIITAGVFTVWGIIIQSAFQPHTPIDNSTFVNSVTVLALLLFLILSVWIRYTTIHRIIVIKKLERSHEIEGILRMKQNSIFRYDPKSLTAPLNSDHSKRRPGGHTLELLLYLSLSTFGGILAVFFQWHLRPIWVLTNYILIGLLFIAPILALLWMSFCKLDAVTNIKGKVTIGFPWNILFSVADPTNQILRRLLNSGQRQV